MSGQTLRSKGKVVSLVLALVGIVTAGAAYAATKYPVRAVTVVHGFKAGGGSDQMSQVTQPFLEKVMGQRFVNVYKPGADGAIAWKEIAKSTAADGYTLTTVLTPKTQLNAIVNPNAGYAMTDFEPIANVLFDPAIIVVAADSKLKTLKDLVEAAKKSPGTVRMSHSGNGGDDWYVALMFAKLSGTKYNLVPFDGDAPAWQAAAGGHVDANTNNVGVVTGLVKGGKLRGLAVLTEKRLASLPDVPTMKELGYDMVDGSYRGYLAPKGTPKEVIDALAEGIEKVQQDPGFKAACAAANMEPVFMKGADFRKFLAGKQESLAKVAKEMGLVN
jgi:tripartite-type tricarboxylate transporter receptor subunit TctC